MRKNMLYVVMLTAMVVSLTQAAEQSVSWNPAANPGNDPNLSYALWTDAANWTRTGTLVQEVPAGGPNNLPSGGGNHFKVQFYTSGAQDCYLDGIKTVGHLVAGDGGVNPGLLHLLPGAQLYAGYKADGSKVWTGCGFGGQGGGIVVEEGALFDTFDHLWIAHGDNASGGLTINGGTVVVHEMFGMNFDGKTTSTGYCRVNDGLLHLMNYNNGQSIRGNSNLDIQKGTVIIRYWRLDLVNACDPGICAQDGRITGYKNANFDKKINVEGGAANSAQNDIINNVVFTWDAANNQTIITAIHPMQPAPALDAVLPIGDVTVEWNNWDPNYAGDSVFAQVFIGTAADPNLFAAGAPINVTGQARSSMVISVPTAGAYRWRVDTDNGADEVHTGDVFTFEATDNLPPVVEAGNGFITWLNEPVQLDATATDDYSAATLTWTADPATGVSFSNAGVEDAVVTVTAEGTYTLTLTADDGFNPPVSDNAILDVYADPCDAARRDGFGTVYATDLVVDCVIDLEDLTELALEWLVNYNLTGPIVR